ncbi:MAG TPA: archaeosortase/exosortase family protein [Bacteroidales bacterium]|nr:archaeosortase/exosortase family protein [Bacteroidales bacterium]
MTGKQNTVKAFITKHQLYVLKGTAIFVLITLIIHFAWRFWAKQFNYAPVTDFMYTIMEAMSVEVYRESVWIISRLYDIVAVDDTMHMYFPNQCIMYINESCSGLKQILQYSMLIIFFPGPWKKKLWFIPLGVIILHITNVFRVVGLAIVMNNWPWYWEFSHDYIFRPLFYVVIFGLWLVWEEWMRKGAGYQVPDAG